MMLGERNGTTCSSAVSIGSTKLTMFRTSLEIATSRDDEGDDDDEK